MLLALLLLLLGSQPLVADHISATLTVTQGDNRPVGTMVWISVYAVPDFGTITNEVWDCENGTLPVGARSSSEPPDTVAYSGTFVPSYGCRYHYAGIYHPWVQVVDDLGGRTEVSTVVTVTN